MSESLLSFKTIIAVIGGFVAYFLGGWDVLLQTFCILVICDFITALISNGINGKIDAKKCAEGIAKKVLYFVIIATAVAANHLMPEIGLREIVITFFIANEGISIIQNSSDFINLPPKFRQFFESLGDADNE